MSSLGNQTKYVDVPYFEGVGTGSQTAFTLSWAPGFPAAIMVVVGGVPQPVSAYSVAGNTLTLSSAPANGARVLVFARGVRGVVGQPADGSITSPKLDPGIVLPAAATMAATPAQFDNDLSVATTAFVQKALGNFSGATLLNSNTVLTADSVGSDIELYGASIFTVTLPLTSAVGNKSAIRILNLSSNTQTIATQGGDAFLNSPGTGSSISLAPGDTIELHSFNGWVVMGGSAALKTSHSFLSSQLASGYQKLPSGLIIQWVSATASIPNASPTGVSATYPIAFPNACLASQASFINIANAAIAPIYNINQTSKTTASVAINQTSGAAQNVTVGWMSIGY